MMKHWRYQLMHRKGKRTGEDTYSMHEYFELDDGPAWTDA